MFKAGWVDADATVIDVKAYEQTGDSIGGWAYCDLILDVQAPNEAPFRAECRVDIHVLSVKNLPHYVPPGRGDTVKVKFDPKKHKVEVQQDDAHDQRLLKKSAKSQWDATLQAGAGSARTGSSPDTDAIAQAIQQQLGLSGNVTVNTTTETIPELDLSGLAQGGAPQPISAATILATGTPGSATLRGTSPSDAAAVKPNTSVVGLTLDVTVAGLPPYQVEQLYGVPNECLPKLAPGAVFPIKADKVTPGLVAIDWDAVIAGG